MSECAAIAQSRKIPKPNDVYNSSSLQTKAQRPTLPSLPTEISDLIFEHLDYIEDVLNLSLASQAFWNIGQKHIRDYFVSFLGPWAGESIICIGEDTRAGDHLPGILTKDDENLLKECVEEGGQPMALYHFIDDYYTTIKADVSLPTTLLGQLLHRAGYRRQMLAELALQIPFNAFRSNRLIFD